MAEELEFLKKVKVGSSQPVFNAMNDIPYELATLLNNYNYNGRWMAGTFGELSVSGFELVYLGDSKGVPDGFVVGLSPLVAIIKLHHGNVTGHICLRT